MRDWLLEYEGFDPREEKLREALCTLGNGYFATRGACFESPADDVHYPGTYRAGGYNRLKTYIKGRDIENEDLVNMPNWLPVYLRINRECWFRCADVDILFYRQQLDMYHGMLYRALRFRDAAGRVTAVKERRLVHMAQPHLAALEIAVTPENWSGELEIISALDGRVINDGVSRYRGLNNRHLEPLEAGHFSADTVFLTVQTTQSKLRISQAARTRIFKDSDAIAYEPAVTEKPGYIAGSISVTVAQGEQIRVEKTVSMYTSRDNAISECALEAKKAVQRAGGFDELSKDHFTAWEHLWRRFVIDAHQRPAQEESRTKMILHLYIFHVLQTTSMHTMDLDVGVPSRGWHGEAYRGHIFWDELYIFPLLNLRMPEITRSLLIYRYRRLNEARAAAAQEGFRGAMYPWQSGSNGREESQRLHLNPKSGRWIPDNSRLQRHVNAAIAYNICQYVQATGDIEFICFYGAEMLFEIARFWASAAVYNEPLGRYEIRGVMGPDEYHESYPGADQPGLNNNAYTNIMVVWVLGEALKVLDMLPADRRSELCESIDLKEEEIERWNDITCRMRIVFHGDGIISQFEGYEDLEEFDWDGYREKYGDIQRLDRILEAESDSPNRYKASKQADVLMLFYLFSSEELSRLFKQLEYPFDYDTIPKNIDYYLKRTSHGSTLSRIVHSWVLARSDRVRSWKLFSEALESDISDIQGGTTPEGIHLGAMAGSVNIIQNGYTGIETRNHVLWLNPCLPEELTSLEMQLRYRGHTLNIQIIGGELIVDSLRTSREPIRVGVKDSEYTLESQGQLRLRL